MGVARSKPELVEFYKNNSSLRLGNGKKNIVLV